MVDEPLARDDGTAGFVPLDLSYWSIAVEKCQLCGYSRRPFYCQSCVKAGNFTASKTYTFFKMAVDVCESTSPVTYAEKYKKWNELKKKNSLLSSRLQAVLSYQEKKKEIELKKNRIQHLKEVIQIVKDKHKTDNSTLEKMKNRKITLHKDTALMKFKLKKISEYLFSLKDKIEEMQEEASLKTEHLIELRREYMHELVTDLFPITTCKNSTESCESLGSSVHQMVNMLKDARFTAFIEGRWVYADSGWDQMYQVLTATLPGNGDYSGYRNAGEVVEASKSPDELQNNPSLNVTAGLSFLVIIVRVASFILDCAMPFQVSLKDIFRPDMTDEIFNRVVSRLNKSVATLCVLQNVDRKKVHGLHTVINIINLAESPDLGRDVPQPSPEDERIHQDARRNSLPVTDSIFACYNDDVDDKPDEMMTDNNLETDWECVPSSLPSYEPSSPQTSLSGDHQSYFSSAVPHSPSVTNIVTSFWKAIGGSGNK